MVFYEYMKSIEGIFLTLSNISLMSIQPWISHDGLLQPYTMIGLDIVQRDMSRLKKYTFTTAYLKMGINLTGTWLHQYLAIQGYFRLKSLYLLCIILSIPCRQQCSTGICGSTAVQSHSVPGASHSLWQLSWSLFPYSSERGKIASRTTVLWRAYTLIIRKKLNAEHGVGYAPSHQ